ncbi:hypothetical protein GOP47_0020235 [Adiantum capillus-veneris]|uniref:Uncharacterized protein n=1 Tax=Adiantum capillus-veneris TaxID=13818 RepID=A0A9D4UCV6_ADICA|nr:hypothetical protein GOP47_0020235 [Adiantum capillus-veneris]
MSMGYTYGDSIPDVSRGIFDPSHSARQDAQASSNRQDAQASLNGHVLKGRKRHADYEQGNVRPDNSPISPLSPPQSSTSSELLSYVGCGNHHDSDVCRDEGSSCSHDDSIEVRAPQRPTSMLGGVSDLMLATSRSHDNTGPPFVSVNDVADMDRKAMIHKQLHELESVLLGPDDVDVDMAELANQNAGTWGEHFDSFLHTGSGTQKLAVSDEMVEKRDGSSDSSRCSLKGYYVQRLLVHCAEAISEERIHVAEIAIKELKKIVSVYGEPLERLGAYMSEGLVARLRASGLAIYKELKCREMPSVEVLSMMQKLYEICPYIKFAYMAANGAIAEAFKDESMVHILDFQIDQGTQWISLIQALASRPGGAPRIRISTIDDSTARSYPLGGMDFVRRRLTKLASSLGISFEFTMISAKVSDLEAHMIERRPGETLAMNFALRLHHMPDESVCLDNPRDRLLRLAKSLNPKVLTLVEQEANTNTAPFLARFIETLDYYSAVFDSIDVALHRESQDRVNVEEHCLAREIVNVIACEGAQRVERYEVAGKWRSRMLMAGFKARPLSLYVNNTIKSLLESYNECYKLKEDGLVLLLGWKNRSLVAASAWQ